MAKDIQVHIDTIRAELAQLGHEAIATELHDAVRYSATGTEIHMRLGAAAGRSRCDGPLQGVARAVQGRHQRDKPAAGVTGCSPTAGKLTAIPRRWLPRKPAVS